MATKPRKVGNRKGEPATPKQTAKLAEGRQAAKKAREARKAAREAEMEKPRWKQLEDGDITLKDLTLQELVRKQCANNDGSWEGRRHAFSPRWQNRMYNEFRKRFRQDFDELAPLALEAFEDILTDEDNPAQRWAAVKTVVEYEMGKPVETVHVGPETEWDRLQATGFHVMRGVDAVEVGERDDHDD
jgi:hypothetical protein